VENVDAAAGPVLGNACTKAHRRRDY